MGCLREGVDEETRDWFASQLVISILLISNPALFLVDQTSSTMDFYLVYCSWRSSASWKDGSRLAPCSSLSCYT